MLAGVPWAVPQKGSTTCAGHVEKSAHPIPTFLPIRWPSRLQSCFSPPSRRCIVVISAASNCGPIELLRLYFNIIWPLALNARSVVCLTVVWAPPLTPPSLSTARERIATKRVPCPHGRAGLLSAMSAMSGDPCAERKLPTLFEKPQLCPCADGCPCPGALVPWCLPLRGPPPSSSSSPIPSPLMAPDSPACQLLLWKMPMLSRRHPARYLVRSLILIGSPSLCDPPKYPFSHTSACLLKQLLSHSVAIRRALGVMFTTRPHL